MTEQELSIQKLETLFDMTSHKGWQELHEDLSAKIDFIKEQAVVSELSAYELGKAQGYVQLGRELLNLRIFTENYLKQAQENANEQVDNV